ncbi:unnamed protein product, partial [Arabidopsis halleri]
MSQLEEYRRFGESRESGEYGGDEVTECEVTANPVGDVWNRSVVLGLCCPKSTLVPVARDGGKSLCDIGRLTDLFEQGVFPEDLAIIVPKPHRRPWNPPEGYICVYEDYFTDGQLRFPLPDFLVQYFGLMMLGNDCGVEVDTDLFEEATTFSVMADNPGLCQVNARSSHKIVYGVKTHDPRPRRARNDISVGLRAIWTRGSLFWPGVIKSSCSPSRLEMGKASCRFPNYSDSFGVSGIVPGEAETIQIDEEPAQGVVQPQLVAEPQQDVGLDVSGRTAVDPGRRAVSEDRAARVSAARSGKKKVRSSCGDFASKVYGSPHEFPPVDSLLGMNLYQTWACKQIQ